MSDHGKPQRQNDSLLSTHGSLLLSESMLRIAVSMQALHTSKRDHISRPHSQHLPRSLGAGDDPVSHTPIRGTWPRTARSEAAARRGDC